MIKQHPIWMIRIQFLYLDPSGEIVFDTTATVWRIDKFPHVYHLNRCERIKQLNAIGTKYPELLYYQGAEDGWSVYVQGRGRRRK